MSVECIDSEDLTSIVDLWDSMFTIPEIQSYLGPSEPPGPPLSEFKSRLANEIDQTSTEAAQFFSGHAGDFTSCYNRLTSQISDLQSTLDSLNPSLSSLLPPGPTEQSVREAQVAAARAHACEFFDVCAFIANPPDLYDVFKDSTRLEAILKNYQFIKDPSNPEFMTNPELRDTVGRFELRINNIPSLIQKEFTKIELTKLDTHVTLLTSQMRFIVELQRISGKNPSIFHCFTALADTLLTCLTAPILNLPSRSSFFGGGDDYTNFRRNLLTEIPLTFDRNDFVPVIQTFLRDLPSAFTHLSDSLSLIFESLRPVSSESVAVTFRRGFSERLLKDFGTLVQKCSDLGSLAVVCLWIRNSPAEPLGDIFGKFWERANQQSQTLCGALKDKLVSSLGSALRQTDTALFSAKCSDTLAGIVGTLARMSEDLGAMDAVYPRKANELPVRHFIDNLARPVIAAFGKCEDKFQIWTVGRYIVVKLADAPAAMDFVRDIGNVVESQMTERLKIGRAHV
jgi:hypothetical protein